MRIGVSAYSFQSLLSSGKSDLPGVIRRARDLGFQGIEFIRDSFPPNDGELLQRAATTRELCAAQGLPVVAYAVGADFLKPAGGGTWKDQVERLKVEVKVASALGAPCMRHDATQGEGAQFEAALPIIAKGCRALTEYAADLGIRTMVENHGYFVQESSRCARLMEAVKHPNFGSLVDIGNFLCADDDPVQAVTRMAAYLVHCHAKDFHLKPAGAPNPGRGWFPTRAGAYLRGAIVGHGVVDVPGCIKVLKRSGYKGFLSIEFEGLEDCILALEIGRENLRSYLASAGCLEE